MKTQSLLLLVICLTGAFTSALSYSNFWDVFYVNFGQPVSEYLPSNVLTLGLSYETGSGFQSKSAYLYGYFAMKLKLVSGNSAGIVSSYYLSSTYNQHCELDFEFLGNETGQPVILQTNVFVEGVGNREQRINLWFDPREDYHTYGIIWNADIVIFFVDNTTIRIFQNLQYMNVPYLDYQEMYAYSSIFDASSWATRGGREKINWAMAPFHASYTDFDIQACPVTPGSSMIYDKHACYKQIYTAPYGSAANRTLTAQQWDDLRKVRLNHIIYDYCTDKSRWTTQPAECSKNWPQ